MSDQVIPDGYEWHVRSSSDIDRVWVLRDRHGVELELEGVSPRIERFVKGTGGPVVAGDSRAPGVTPIYVRSRLRRVEIAAAAAAGAAVVGIVEVVRLVVS
jgi:hypothetical protein